MVLHRTRGTRARNPRRDGRIDLRVTLDGGGARVREERDLDAHGRPRAVAHYERGTLVRLDEDPSRTGRVVRRSHCERDQLARVEEDRNADGRPDV